MTQIVAKIEKPSIVDVADLSYQDVRNKLIVFITTCGSLRVLVELSGEYAFTHLLSAQSANRQSGHSIWGRTDGRSTGGDKSFTASTGVGAIRNALKHGREVHLFDNGIEAARWWLSEVDKDDSCKR